MENGGLIKADNQRYNYIKMPNFNLKSNMDYNLNKNNNYLSQSQIISNKNKENPLTQSIANKIKEMKEELSKDNYSNTKNENNDFRIRLERISKGNFCSKNKGNNDNNALRNSKKEIDFKIMKKKIKTFEDQREKEKLQKKNALDELDDIFNNFRNNRYGK